jgi:hypothetical protein
MYEALLRYGKMRGHHNVGFTHTVTNIKGENLHLGDVSSLTICDDVIIAHSNELTLILPGRYSKLHSSTVASSSTNSSLERIIEVKSITITKAFS